MYKWIQKNKTFVTCMILLVVVISYNFLSTQVAGYSYFKFTAIQLEIIPKNVEWEKRTVIQDSEQINDLLSVISESRPYAGDQLICEIEDRDMRILIRSKFSKDALSWVVCEGEKSTYLLPILVGKRETVYETDKKLLSMLEASIISNE